MIEPVLWRVECVKRVETCPPAPAPGAHSCLPREGQAVEPPTPEQQRALLLRVRLLFLFCVTWAVPALAEAPARYVLMAELGVGGGASTWKGDYLGCGSLLLGARLFDWVTIHGRIREGYANVDQRLVTTLAFGAGIAPKMSGMMRLRPESGCPSTRRVRGCWRKDPWLVPFGVGSGVRHRMGGELVLGPRLRGARAELPQDHRWRRSLRIPLTRRPWTLDVSRCARPGRGGGGPMNRLLPVFLGGVLFYDAGCSIAQLEDAECPPGGTTLSYENFGQDFMAAWCVRCHQPYTTDRHGAPGEFNFDNLRGIKQSQARIFARAALDNDSMPPGPNNPPREEREDLAEWLACGAPSEHE